MDLLIELKKDNEVIIESSLAYYDELHFALKFSKIVSEGYTYLLNEKGSSDFRRVVLALRAVDAYPNMSFDYGAIHSYVPNYKF